MTTPRRARSAAPPAAGLARESTREVKVTEKKHTVRFEPVGIEIEVDDEQTVLRAAFDQGLMLMHGCKEGQCSACKSFLLDGDDVELDKYSKIGRAHV